jgi:hypothetical protein
VSIQDLQQNPQDTSNFYLANIYQTIADPSRSNISSSLPASPPPFSPPSYAVWVNSLWFLSLAISITCALLATLLQQWARRYLKATRTRYALHKRARFRSFFAEGVENSLLPWAVEALPTLLHLSVFLFFAGLVVFLRNVNLTAFKVVLSWISVCTSLYGCITLIPVFRRDSPYYTPLTLLARPVVAVILCFFFFPSVTLAGFLFLFSLFSCCVGPYRIFGYLINWFIRIWDITFETAEEAVRRSTSEIDTRALMWTFGRLDEDHELVHFFSNMPGFHSSKVLKEPLSSLKDDQKHQLLAAMVGLLDRTLSSDLFPDLKCQRADVCFTAIDLVYTPKAFSEIVLKFASEDGYGPVNSTDIVHFIKRWDSDKDEDSVAQGMFSIVVARVQRHDDSWFALASKELGRPEAVLREHAAHGDSLPLAILIHITRQQFIHFGNTSWPSDAIASVLEAASKFNAQDTSAELQHEFCALWNEIARKAQNDTEWKIANNMLRRIRRVYLTLHHDTNSAPTRFDAFTTEQDEVLDLPASYPVCNVAGHSHDHSAPTTVALTQPDNTTPSPPSFPSPPAPFHLDEKLTTMLLPDNSHTTHQTAENFSGAATSLDHTTAGPIQDTAAPGITMPYPTPQTSTSAHFHFPTSPPTAVSLQHPLTPSDSPNLPLSASNPVLDDILSIGPSLSTTHLCMTPSDL